MTDPDSLEKFNTIKKLAEETDYTEYQLSQMDEETLNDVIAELLSDTKTGWL